jgi:NitT/TauT family transport system ATP-binding protein
MNTANLITNNDSSHTVNSIPAVQVRAVSKIFAAPRPDAPAVEALRDVSFNVNEGEFCCLLGHSGCGKTTLLNMLAGFDVPTSGELRVAGQIVSGPGWDRTMVFQDYALFPWLNVENNVSFGLDMKDTPAADKREIIQRHLRLVGLAGFEKHLPYQLSGGMRQRVAIARALAVDPKVALFDEPFAALDAQNRTVLQDELVRISMATRKTMLLITHSIEEAVKLSDRVIVMTARPGRVKENVVIDLPKPRDENDPAVIAMKARIKRLIIEETLTTMY